MRAYETARLDELTGADGWAPIRKHFGVQSFGINAWTAVEAGGRLIPEHDEAPSGHEELYVVLSGKATFRVDGEEVDAPAGTIVFVRDPAVRRHARAEEAGTSVLAVGGPRDKVYQPSPWEYWFAAERHRASGDYDAMVDEISAGLQQYPDHPAVLYYLGRAEALAGRTDVALAHVIRALELRPEWSDHIRQDEELAPLHDLPGWPL